MAHALPLLQAPSDDGATRRRGSNQRAQEDVMADMDRSSQQSQGTRGDESDSSDSRGRGGYGDSSGFSGGGTSASSESAASSRESSSRSSSGASDDASDDASSEEMDLPQHHELQNRPDVGMRGRSTRRSDEGMR
jgi:hypothetical protein